jgi:hypothetical protein
LDDVVERVRWELEARVLSGDDTNTAEGRGFIAELVADAVLDVWTIRHRTNLPRSRR